MNPNTQAILTVIKSMNGFTLHDFLQDVAQIKSCGAIVPIARAAELLGVSRRTIDRWMDKGIIKKYKIPGTLQVGVNHFELRTLKNQKGGSMS